MTQSPATLVPFVITLRQNRHLLKLDDLDLDPALRVLEVEDEVWATFYQLMNKTNQLAFGGDSMGMPLWVLLDCGLLPAAVSGYMVPREQAPAALMAQLGAQAQDQAWIPVAEYCASPSLEAGCVSGFSLQSQLPGHNLGVRAKALGLLAFGSRAHVGVTQFDNSSIRVHCRLGPLQITCHRPSVHTHPKRSFIYRLELPPRDTLLAIVRGEIKGVEPAPILGEPWRFDIHDASHHARLRALLDQGRRVFVSPPGWSRDGEHICLSLVIADIMEHEVKDAFS
jgi:hypothetical protein